ncbi:FtsK/SpoIIIE domain-containing protein [Mycolicibacterium llatzerense]|uniref:FtsK/SpoIIIE domain-containing protein n=1 Tax=Mycolicibacterium llatzerense TaxID=280871 RepID=UPI0008DCA708|nr:FtsK/SpoIIIE domain-containing protein [Mycolicibacterium llatzerense]
MNRDEGSKPIDDGVVNGPPPVRRGDVPSRPWTRSAAPAEVSDLAAVQHLLIRGSTGSGPRKYIDARLVSMLLRTTPHQVRMLLIDPMLASLGRYQDIPQLITPVIVDPRKAITALGWLADEVARRQREKPTIRAGRIDDDNAAPTETATRWPRIVTVVTGLADLMMTDPRGTEDAITCLTPHAHTVGVHLGGRHPLPATHQTRC